MSNLEDREDIPYTSQANLYEDNTAPSEDEADLPALKRVMKELDEAEKKASDIKLIDLAHPKLSAEAQILGYQFALTELILPLKRTIQSAIDNVENQNRGGSK